MLADAPGGSSQAIFLKTAEGIGFTEEELADPDAWIDAGERELQEMRKRRGR